MIDQVAQKLTIAELQTKYDLDEHSALIIHKASGGWAPLVGAAIAAAQATSHSLDELLGSPGLADFVVSQADDVSLPLPPSDQHALEVLSLLEGIDEGVARVAFDVAAEQWADPAWVDAPTVLLRLQISGAVSAESEESPWHVPLLIAAWARKTLMQDEAEGVSAAVEKSLAEAFTSQVELASSSDSLLVDNAVVLARRARAWELLDRIFLARGYPLFYLYPRTSVAAFAQLPAPALRAVPDLEEVTTVATMVQEALLEAGVQTQAASGELVRSHVARLTAPGVLRGEHAAEDRPVGEKPVPGQPGEVGAPGAPMRFHSVMSEMARLGADGEHRDAAEAGAGWIASGVVRRTRRIVRLQASIHSVMASQPGRALALLRSFEDEVKEDHEAGDFLAPAVIAWTALAAYLAGDHERADAEYVKLVRLDFPPFVQEQRFRPAMLVVHAYRSLDRLDLAAVEDTIHRMRDYPEMDVLWNHVPIIERLLSQLAATSLSAMLQSEESIDMRSRGVGVCGSTAEMLLASRIGMLISLGQLRRAEMLLEKITRLSGVGKVLLARSELVAGRNDIAIRIAEAQYYENDIDTRDRAQLIGIKAAALLRLGDPAKAHQAFLELLELTVLVGSALPIVQLPLVERKELIRMSADEPVWRNVEELLDSSAHPRDRGSTGNDIRQAAFDKLSSLGQAVVGVVDFPMLGRREMTLLEKLDQGVSIGEIAHELRLVQGTVKNNLSSLYRKLGVSGREAAVARARELGYLGPGGS